MAASDIDVAGMIDHALLSPNLTVDQLDAGIRIGRAYGVASVCLLPYYVSRCCELLTGSATRTSTTIGFPHGAQATSVKLAEAEQAIRDGCVELDMVVNISRVLSGRWDDVRAEIQAIVDVAHAAGRRVKVIFENCYLEDQQKIRLCEISSEAQADWVKTSTGFGPGGATLADVKLMCRHVAAPVQVKAAGGIRDLVTVLAMRDAGATRIGLSQTQAILSELRQRLDLPPIRIECEDSSAVSGY